MLESHRIFWREFRESFHTTGSLLPSGRFLGRALARFVGQQPHAQRILEVGPGTGAVTRHIVRAMQPRDTLDLVEINARFARHLRQRVQQERPFRPAASRIRVIEDDVANLGCDAHYDIIISGLPFNNFSASTVRSLLLALMRLLRPGGTLSFFQYVGVRKLKSLLSSTDQRRRIRAVGQVLDDLLDQHELARDLISINVPPAWVHHVRRPSESDAGT